MTHEQYLEEPVETVDWALALAGLSNEMIDHQLSKARHG